MPPRPLPSRRSLSLAVLAASAFIITAILRYSLPEGSLGGLTDDHFFYVTQGWQMLFGELPDRDYFEPGAPLTLATSAAAQVVLGRSVWSEYVVCVAALAGGTALASVLAARASGSILLGGMAFLFQFALLTRLYNYPKVITYAAAIAAMWAWSSSPRASRAWVVALVTAVSFLLRHDHGVYIGIAFATALLVTGGLTLKERLQQGALYGVATAVLLAPYLAFLQWHGGIARHFTAAYAWAARDYLRSPRVLPRFEWQPLFAEVATEAPRSEWWEHAPYPALAEHATFWLFWLFMVLPVVGVALLVIRPAGRSDWSRDAARIGPVIVLAALVDYGFLRGNIAGRLADVSVPLAILSAWVLARAGTLVATGRADVWSRPWRLGAVPRTILGAVLAASVLVTALVLVRPLAGAVHNTRVTEGIGGMRTGFRLVSERLRNTWPLDPLDSRPEFLIARYLQACTGPTDRVLVTEFRPHVIGLSQRAFAAGHVDLRSGGFFGTVGEQELSLARWRRQSVPIVIGPTLDDWPAWSEGLPLVAAHLVREYRNLGEQDVAGFRFLLFTHRDAQVRRTHASLGLPCFR